MAEEKAKEQTKEIIKLGTDEVFVLKDKAGEIRAFEHRLELTEQNGGLIQPGYGKPWVISAQGYEMWAESAGASVIMPREVVVDGELRGNPCIVSDENDRVISATARAIAFRFSSKGIPQVSDWTTILDLDQYRMVDLLAKAKRTPQAFRLLPIEMGMPKDEGTWAKYYFDPSTALWINTTHPEALTWYSQIRQREKKIVDFAQTFAKRNANKHLSGLQKSPSGPNWELKVLCWRPMNNSMVKWDATQYKELQDNIHNLIEGEPLPIEKTSGTENALEDENLDALVQNTDPEDSPEDEVVDAQFEPATETTTTQDEIESMRMQKQLDADAETAEPPPEPKEEPAELTFNEFGEMEVIKNNLLSGQENFPKEFAEACAQNKVQPTSLEKADPKTMNKEKCMKIQNDLNSILDKKAV